MKKLMVLLMGLFLITVTSALAGQIHQAAENGDLAGIKTILSENPGIVNDKNSENNTSLHLAAINGHKEIVEMLISSGADINLGDNENSPPIVNAALLGNFEIVELMIKNGASATLKDDNEMTPLHFAAMGGNPQIIQLLLDKGADVNAVNHNSLTPLMYAAYRGKTDAIRLLTEKGGDLETKTSGGENLIHGAANNGSVEAMEFLLSHGADVNAKDDNDETPLFDAVSRDRLEATQWLLEHGADVGAISKQGESIIHLSAFSNNPELIEMILESGADPNQANAQGLRPLHYSLFRGQIESARTLLSRGADPNVQDERGRTPLYEAVRRGAYDICELFISEGSDVNIKENKQGRSPLHLAAIKGYADIVGLLLANKANVNAKDNAGRTPLFYSGKYAHKGAADILTARGAVAENMEKNFGHSPLLNKPLAKKEAVVWYTGHAGWTVRTKNHLLVFDYWGGDSQPAEPSLSNGYMNPSELQDLNVTVFSSHAHRDHYDPVIFDWKDSKPDINYIFGFEPDSAIGYQYLGPRENRMFNGVKVSTITSNDEGVGFLVEADGMTIFHAGDHANRQQDFSGPFKAEIDYLGEMGQDIDLAFMSISGCGFGDLEAVKLGVYYTLETLKPNIMFPQHSVDAEYRYREFADEAANQHFKTKFMCPENRGDHFTYRDGTVAF